MKEKDYILRYRLACRYYKLKNVYGQIKNYNITRPHLSNKKPFPKKELKIKLLQCFYYKNNIDESKKWPSLYFQILNLFKKCKQSSLKNV